MQRLIGALLGGLAEVLAFVLFGLEYLVVYLPKRAVRKARSMRRETTAVDGDTAQPAPTTWGDAVQRSVAGVLVLLLVLASELPALAVRAWRNLKGRL